VGPKFQVLKEKKTVVVTKVKAVQTEKRKAAEGKVGKA